MLYLYVKIRIEKNAKTWNVAQIYKRCHISTTQLFVLRVNTKTKVQVRKYGQQRFKATLLETKYIACEIVNKRSLNVSKES